MATMLAPAPLGGGFLAASAPIAVGLLALLDEDVPALQQHALVELYKIIDQHWAEVANKLPQIEALSEDEAFPHRELAAAVASRCFFHLEEYNDALRLALGAGSYFDVSAPSAGRTAAENQYVDTLVSKCIGESVRSRARLLCGGVSIVLVSPGVCSCSF